MELGLRGKLIVVGGGSGGIGRFVVETLRHEGAEVVIATGVDLANPGEVQEYFAGLRKVYKELYGYCSLVWGGSDSPLHRVIPEEIEETWKNTFLAALYPIQEAVRWMRETGGGHIVIVSSVNSLLGLNEFPYDAAKGAVNRIAPDICAGYGKDGICAVTLCPGTVMGTPSWEGKEEMLAKIASTVPDGKLTTATEVANAIAFLMSDHVRMFNGGTLIADRGWHLRPMNWK